MNGPAANRRTQTRFRATLPVTDGRVATTTRDVSADGMYVRGLSYPRGTRISLAVIFPDTGVPMRVAADVVRTEQAGVALRLVHVNEPQRSTFSGAIVRLARAKTDPA